MQDKFFETEGDKVNNFKEAFLYYVTDLSEGNYDTLEYYTQNREDLSWEQQDEMDVLKSLTCERFSEIMPKKFQAKFSPPFGLPAIANLWASFKFVEKQQNLHSNKRFDNINQHQELAVTVEANMPGPCLAYLEALKNSNVEVKLKALFIHEIIKNTSSRLKKNTISFGSLDTILFKRAVNDLIQIFEQNSENAKLGELQEIFVDSGKLERYKARAEKYKITEFSSIDILVINILRKLGIDINEINPLSKQEPATMSNMSIFNPSKKYNSKDYITLSEERVERFFYNIVFPKNISESQPELPCPFKNQDLDSLNNPLLNYILKSVLENIRSTLKSLLENIANKFLSDFRISGVESLLLSDRTIISIISEIYKCPLDFIDARQNFSIKFRYTDNMNAAIVLRISDDDCNTSENSLIRVFIKTYNFYQEKNCPSNQIGISEVYQEIYKKLIENPQIIFDEYEIIFRAQTEQDLYSAIIQLTDRNMPAVDEAVKILKLIAPLPYKNYQLIQTKEALSPPTPQVEKV